MPAQPQPKAMAPIAPNTNRASLESFGSPATKSTQYASTKPTRAEAQCMNVGPIKAEARREILFMGGEHISPLPLPASDVDVRKAIP
jgi:hypothetical protein